MSDKLYVVYKTIGKNADKVAVITHYSRKSRAEEYCNIVNSNTGFNLKVCEIDLINTIIKQEGLDNNADNSI